VPGGGSICSQSAKGSGTEFVAKCVENNLLVIPGGVFSTETPLPRQLRATDETLDRHRDIESPVLNRVPGAMLVYFIIHSNHLILGSGPRGRLGVRRSMQGRHQSDRE